MLGLCCFVVWRFKKKAEFWKFGGVEFLLEIFAWFTAVCFCIIMREEKCTVLVSSSCFQFWLCGLLFRSFSSVVRIRHSLWAIMVWPLMSEPKIFREFLEFFSIPWWTVVCLQGNWVSTQCEDLVQSWYNCLAWCGMHDFDYWKSAVFVMNNKRVFSCWQTRKNQLTGFPILKLDIVTYVMVHCGDWECLLGTADSSWLHFLPYGLSQETKFSVAANFWFSLHLDSWWANGGPRAPPPVTKLHWYFLVPLGL